MSYSEILLSQKYFETQGILVYNISGSFHVISQEYFNLFSFSGIFSLNIFILRGTSTAEVLHNLENIY